MRHLLGSVRPLFKFVEPAPATKEVKNSFPTRALDAVTQVDGEVVHNVHQELEVVDVVHVNAVGFGGNGPQLVLVGVLHT